MKIARVFWLVVGASSLVLGAIGAVLPLLPTTPFLILGAFAFSKSSPKLEAWLLDHPRFGPAIHNWRTERAIARKAKWLASLVMVLTVVIGGLAGLSMMILAIQTGIFVLVLAFLWTRPEPGKKSVPNGS
ncbi:YbaN family protein [Fulvimarina sp. MAC3]|uniref:YbaN family protein n=1 Tax=Fulvimarina sp. MAC3 TaxID=3148887 RepID=UPI0031FDA7C7